ncbi:MmgE/PrpD family protein [Aeromicrobium duanguangcaii]|uniref:MmgE/PrpD family protein n=1 Tax=Aeromicrobium duanguangcaii TaxID=2968086 RepID=A0ABY5KGV2_9ACTN|nr:MmgE/PrpD family protein [Aeromicrobium duanguangcaii]MCD9155074.1 MmgE/PrpD family protein [Aeromicrobium duanguangcaii]UUI68271.1 MmgE/PrpD family protein [Aeromicrobium duanguangcaii]
MSIDTHEPAVSGGLDADAPISSRIGHFAHSLTFEDIPADVVEAAKLLVLDSIGIAFASGTFDFAAQARAAVDELSEGESGPATVIGAAQGHSLRDAVLLNGLLVHGLDFDDTHPEGVIHASASALPTALGLTERLHLSGRDLLTAYIAGLEVDARLGMAARGGFHQVGFHPTGLIGAFGAAVVAGRLRGLSAEQIAQAQGFVGSLASGSLEFLETGAWTKRVHPGWAGVAGLTAASFARQGFVSPPRIYEGRFGLYASHLGTADPDDLVECTRDLGQTWETTRVAVKPFPACHFTHAFADAVIALRTEHGLTAQDVESIHCLIAEGEIKTVCEPIENKRAPQSAYDAQFSVPYVTAAALVTGDFTLRELEPQALADPEVLALAQKVTYEVDPKSGFPALFSGEVIIRTTDGRELRHREQVNRGADSRPLSRADIEAKFAVTAGLGCAPGQAEQIAAAVDALDTATDVADLAALLRA